MTCETCDHWRALPMSVTGLEKQGECESQTSPEYLQFTTPIDSCEKWRKLMKDYI